MVLGPNADNAISVLGNYNGTPSQTVTALQGIKQKLGAETQVVFEKAVNFTNDTLLYYINLNDRYAIGGRPGFKAEYFDNKELKGAPVHTSTDTIPNHFWQEGENLVNGRKAENFSARFSTIFTPGTDESISFEVEADDGYRFFINDKEVINAWERNRWGSKTFDLEAKKDSVYKLVLEYWQGEGKGNVKLSAGKFGQTDYNKILNQASDADAIIFVGGISPQLEGEEMKVNLPGFDGGDRTSIQLPTVQTSLMKKLQATGKPVVFVMMTGSAIAIPWEKENIPGIINAWYGGQSAGTAIADVLFGDYNPSGKLPVTFYASDSDLPDFKDYSMKGRTYRYFRGDALYPFGYGLSYTNFEYSKLNVPATIKRGNTVVVKATVTNTGKRTGEEVAQLYLAHDQQNNIETPVRSLKGFKRIMLKPGETKTVSFTLTAEQLSLVDNKGNSYQPKGKVSISLGGGQQGTETSNVITTTTIIR